MKKSFNQLVGLVSLLSCSFSYALPIDWTGNIGFDQNIIKNVRGTTDSCAVAAGSECITDDADHARFQTLLLKLNPNIIVNDSVTIKGEISTGSFRGGFLGDNANSDDSYFAQSNSGSSLNFNQLYAELYADTALFRVGKYSKHYGLGAVINSGNGAWDRFFSGYEGFEAEFKLGNFKLIPAMNKLGTDNPGAAPNNESRNNGDFDATEQSITAIYNNPNKNLQVGIFYGVRSVENQSDLNGTGALSDSQNVTIIDIFFEKAWGDFNFALEVPLVSGEVGRAYNITGTKDQDIDSRAVILETSYQLNPKWKIGLNAGNISGSDNDQDSHEAMYLHPNYQIAEIMFRYNREGFQSQSENSFRSNIVNTNYAKLFAHYENDAWGWRFDVIVAKALETAETGKDFYSHKSNTYQTASADQNDDYGIEYDIAFDYKWSPSVVVTGYLGYYQVGDFYAFTNSATEVEVSDITATGMKVNIGF